MVRIILVLSLLVPGVAWAQAANEQTYAEIRAELDVLKGQVQGLRNELITATPRETGVANAGPLLIRVDQMEEELRRLTGQVEQLGFRLDAVVRDGSNRIGDLEFRLVELEGGDFSTLGETRPLGEGGVASPAASNTPAPANAPLAPLTDESTEIAGLAGAISNTVRPRLRSGTQNLVNVSTQATATATLPETPTTQVPQGFDMALGAFRDGRFAEAVSGFDAYIASQPSGPQVSEAAFWRGEALAAQGSWNLAARSFLDAFSGAPKGVKAPEALLRLGVSLGRLGQFNEACLTLGEVGKRFPQAGGEIAQRTQSELRALSCS